MSTVEPATWKVKSPGVLSYSVVYVVNESVFGCQNFICQLLGEVVHSANV